jgi:hypothetical protein
VSRRSRFGTGSAHGDSGRGHSPGQAIGVILGGLHLGRPGQVGLPGQRGEESDGRGLAQSFGVAQAVQADKAMGPNDVGGDQLGRRAVYLQRTPQVVEKLGLQNSQGSSGVVSRHGQFLLDYGLPYPLGSNAAKATKNLTLGVKERIKGELPSGPELCDRQGIYCDRRRVMRPLAGLL